MFLRLNDINFLIYIQVFKHTGKKHRQIKLKRLQKVQIWAFGQLVQQINSLQEVLRLKQNFQKNKVVTGKTLCDRSIL